MSARLRALDLGYRYPSASTPALRGVSVELQPGELVLLTGATGCGKSTLLRLFGGLLPRHGQGERLGQVWVEGYDPAALVAAQRVQRVAFVSQEPADQLITGQIGDELAFAAQSAGLIEPELGERVRRNHLASGLNLPLSHPCGALSGGQQQRLATAAALSAGARLLLLDEPLAALDPGGARDLVAQLVELAAQGVTVVVVEHRLEPLLPSCHRALVLAEGELVWEGAAPDLDAAALRRLGLRAPGAWALREALQARGLDPEAVVFSAPETQVLEKTEQVLSLSNASWSYGQRPALQDLSLTLRRGERLALIGANGAGKSTLLAALAGDLSAGTLRAEGRVVQVPQDPDLALFCATVAEELAHGPQEQGLSGQALAQRVEAASRGLGLLGLEQQAPQALSRGQRLRLATAAALTCSPQVLLLDEPTAGQDLEQVRRLMTALREALPRGALVFATHDLELAWREATRVLVLHEGRVWAEGEPTRALSQLPPGLEAPPLLRVALERGLPPADPEALASWARPGPAQALIPAETPRPEAQSPLPEASEAQLSLGLDPRARLALLVSVGLLALALNRPLSLGLLTALCAAPLFSPRVPRVWRWRALLGVLTIVWSTVLSQGLFYAALPRVPLLELGPLTLWREGVLHGLNQSLRFVSVSLAGLGLVALTPVDRLLAALAALRLPPPLTLMLTAALQALPELSKGLASTRRARARRGRPAHHRAPWAWLALELSLLRPAVARLLRRARTLGEALDARGFDPQAARLGRSLPPWPRGHLALALSGMLLACVALGLRLLYGLYATDTWYHPALRGLYGLVRVWL